MGAEGGGEREFDAVVLLLSTRNCIGYGLPTSSHPIHVHVACIPWHFPMHFCVHMHHCNDQCVYSWWLAFSSMITA